MDKGTTKEAAVPSKSNALEQKNAANLKRTLGQTIQAFEKNKEWADYGHWLQKVMKCLEDYPSYNIPEKLTFGKRLAQCLNPALPPSIHINTIQVYSLIFRIMKDTGYNWCDDLGLYSIGIFPLFQYAASQVKPKILSLYRDHYFPLGKQLIPCITGLTVSILPGVEEPNEAMQKDVFFTLDQLSNAVTKKYFVGAVWMAVLRNPKVRLSGIKYLSKRLKRTYVDIEEEGEAQKEEDETESEPEAHSEEEEAEEEEVEEVEEVEGEHAEENAEEAVEQQSPTKEEAKEETTTIAPEEPSRIMLRYLPTAEDEAFLRSLDHENNDDISVEYPNKSSLVLNALIAALEDENNNVQKACLDFMATHFKLASDLFTENEKYILLEAALNLLIKKDQQILRRVYTWIFGPADMENKYQITEKNQIVLEYLITAFRKIFSRVPKDAFQATLPLKVLQNFYMEHDHLVEQTLPSLSIPFLSYVYRYSQAGRDFSDEVQKAGARFMENITSYFSTLLTSLSESLDVGINEQDNEKCLEIINLIEFTFRLESAIVNKEENINYLEQKNYLKAIISGILRSVSSVSPDQSNLASFIETALNLNLNLIDKLEKVERDLTDLIREKNLTEEEINQIMAPGHFDYGFRETLDRYNVFYERIVDQILAFHYESQISQKALNLFAAASETIVKIQTFQDDTTLTELPFWVHSVLQCVRSSFPAVSIIGIKTMQSLLVLSSKKPIYEIIRNLIAKTEESNNRGNDDIIRRTTEKLWGLLDVHYIQNTVSDLLLVFQSHFPEIFSETVSNSFDVPSITGKEAAIRRFGSFWKIASDMARSDFIESGIGLLEMLEFLDHDNPLLRHSSKSWLLDAIPYLYRIIDPIFEILMQTRKDKDGHHLRLYATDTKQYFFTEVYDTEIVQHSFRKLRGILITSNELFVRYIISIKVSERLRKHHLFFTENDLSIQEPCTYLDLLVTLCLKYIQGHAIEALSPKFQNQNASVNASASEFMELLITHIENKELSAQITHFIMEPVLIVLHHAINNNDYVLQVQLLNLMKVVLYQSSFCNYEPTRYKCVALLSSPRFVPNLLRGLHVDQQYVRVQFINFISMCMSVLTENLHQPDVLKDNVILILRAYFDIILSKNLQVAENNDEFEPWESDNVSFEDDIKNRKIDMIAGDESKKDEKSRARGTFTIKSQSQNEIYILLEGVKKILDYFLKFNTIPEKEAGTIFHGAEGPGVFTVVKDIFTMGFLQKSAAEDKKDLASIAHADTSQAILKDLLRVVYILIYCWRLSKEFRMSADFSPMGITPYTFEKYNEINKMVKDNHMKIDPHAKTVKSLIISVLKPLTYQYTNETINAFLNYWMRECQKKQDLSLNPRLMKEIEILVSMNVPTEMFITALSKNQIVIDINREYQEEIKKNKKGPAVLSYTSAKTEAHIFFLLYTYISYSYIDMSFLKKDYLMKLWTTALNFTKLFTISRSITTHLWLIEFLNLLSLKYNPKEILGDNKIKKEMHAQINALLVQIANTSAKNVVIYFNRPGSGSDIPRFRTVAPFTPTIYQIYKSYVKNQVRARSLPGSQNELGENAEHEVHQENSRIERLMFRNFEEDVSEQSLYDRYRLFGLKTLKQVGLPVLQNSYSPERIDRVIVRTKEFMVIVFPLIGNKSSENKHFAECASELLYSQLEDSRSFLIKDYKKDILDIFNGDDFFKCSKQTLKYWSKIIDWVVTMDRGDLFSEFMTKWANAFSFFVSAASGEKQKIKAFERICFIIYSGEKDKYQDKLFLLLEKMGEIIKNADETNPALVILVLFSMRILILRLSPSSLNELFRHIWPILLTLLMQIFKKGKIPKNPNLILATLKLIEMMSIVQLEEFFINQWVFIFDYFGLTIDASSGGDFMNSSTGLSVTQPSIEGMDGEPKGPKISGFVYQPYITNVVQPDLKIDYKPKQIWVQEDYVKPERKIIVTQTHVRGEQEIQEQAFNLIQYLIQQNEFRTQADPNEVENLIEGDFISFDDYIFDIRDPTKP